MLARWVRGIDEASVTLWRKLLAVLGPSFTPSGTAFTSGLDSPELLIGPETITTSSSSPTPRLRFDISGSLSFGGPGGFSRLCTRTAATAFMGVMKPRGIGRGRDLLGGVRAVSEVDLGDAVCAGDDRRELRQGEWEFRAVLVDGPEKEPYCRIVSYEPTPMDIADRVTGSP
jgi:hypothetical protein